MITFSMSDQEQVIPVFNFRADTKELIDSGKAYIPPHTGLPSNCTTIAPPEKAAGFAAVYDEAKSVWNLVEDHRGETVYDIASGQPLLITEPGILPKGLTMLPPSSPYDEWNGDVWMKNYSAEAEAKMRDAQDKKKELMSFANDSILPLQDAVDLGMPTEHEQAELIAWKKYRIALNRLVIDDAENISWPELPSV